MAQLTQAADKKKFSTKFLEFLQKIRIFLFVFFGLIIVAVIVIAVWSEVRKSRIEVSMAAIESVQQHYDELQASTDETESATLRTSLLSEIETVIGEYRGYYAEQKALFLRAWLNREEDPAAAVTDFVAASEADRSSYLAPLSLYNAAIIREATGEGEAALETYGNLVRDYPRYPDAARCLFACGRIEEGRQNWENAAVFYNRMVDEYPSDDWTNLARDRIIDLTIAGRIVAGSEASVSANSGASVPAASGN